MRRLKRAITLMLTMSMLASSFLACGTSSGDDTDTKKTENGSINGGDVTSGNGETFVYAMGSSWDTLFPYGGSAENYGTNTWQVMYSTLAYIDGKDEFMSNGAIIDKSYSSEDGMELTFKCNPDLKWSDGEAVTANDWFYTFKTITDASLVCTFKPFFNIFQGIDETGNIEAGKTIEDAIKVTDDYTFTLYMDDATNIESFLYAYNTYFFVLPEHCLKDIAPADLPTSEFFDHPVSSSPWVLEEEIAGSQLTFGRNPYFPYWDSYSNISNYVIKVVGTEVMVEGLASGELSYIMNTMSSGDCAEAVELDGIAGEPLDEPTMIVVLAYNLNKLTDARVRKAFDYALNREYLCEQVMGGQALPVNTFERSRYLNTDIKTVYSLDKAKELFDAAAADGAFDYHTPLTIGVVSGFREQVAAVMKQDLATIGVTLDIVTGDGTTILGKMQEEGAYDLCLVGGGIGADATWPANDYLNPQVKTYGQVTDSKYYDLCMEINACSDETKRMELIHEFQTMMYEEAPYVFVFNMITWRIYSDSCVFRDDVVSKAFGETTLPWNIRME